MTRYLALGDSYTIGEGVAAAGRWPQQLVHRLRAEGIAIDEPEIIATTGWTTDELAAAMDKAQPRPPYALVTLLIGVNNQYRDRPVGEYRGEFLALLMRAIALAGDARRTLVVSIPDWGVTRFAHDRDRATIATAIDAYNSVAEGETVRAHARWIDITGLSRQAGDRPAMLVEDGLHPSAEQYGQWVGRILPAARAALKEVART
jgi:lysophospholipase L1-like esterase